MIENNKLSDDPNEDVIQHILSLLDFYVERNSIEQEWIGRIKAALLSGMSLMALLAKFNKDFSDRRYATYINVTDNCMYRCELRINIIENTAINENDQTKSKSD